MDRILGGTAGQIKLRLQDSNGDPVAGATPVTVTVTNGLGTALTGSPFTASEDANEPGLYAASLGVTQTAVLGEYKCVWSAPVAAVTQTFLERFEIVGAYMFGEAELRSAFPDVFGDRDRFNGEEVAAVREAIEERLEQLMGAQRPKGRAVKLYGDGADLVLPDDLPRRVVSVTIDGTAFTSTEIAALELHDEGIIYRESGWGSERISIVYEHGPTGPAEPVRRGAMALAKEALVGSALFSRTSAVQTGEGFFRQTLAGRDGPTGLPEMDALVKQFGRRVEIA